MALQRAPGPWEAGFPLDDLTVLWDKEGMLRQGRKEARARRPQERQDGWWWGRPRESSLRYQY